MNGKIKVFEDRIEVVGQMGITPNVQGETGLVFPREIIQESVDDYLRLIEVAPYYRVMLDSHIELKNAKWSNVGGMIDDVYVDAGDAVRINYTIFGGTAVYNALKIMHNSGANILSPVSTRGLGKIRQVRANERDYMARGQEPKRVKMIRKLGDSQVTYWRNLGNKVYKNVLKVLDNFILLGWDLVVLPSQMEAGLPLISSAPKIVAESAGGFHVKLMSDNLIDMSNFVVNELSGNVSLDIREAAASLNREVSPVSPHIRLKLLDINNDFATNIQVTKESGTAEIVW